MTPPNYHQRTRGYYAERGLALEQVDRYDARAKRWNDLFGFLDFIACGGGVTIGVQMTAGGHLNARKRKILGECREAACWWLGGGNRIEVIDWRLRTPRRKKGAQEAAQAFWEAVVEEITEESFTEIMEAPTP